MRIFGRLRGVARQGFIAGLSAALIGLTLGSALAEEERWINPLCKPLPADRNGPFVALPDGGLMTVCAAGLCTSRDEGRTWSEPLPVCKGLALREPAAFYVLRTRGGALVVVYLDFSNYKFKWDEKTGEPGDCRLELWSIRSLDGGKTWIDKQQILDGYNANFFGFIQTGKGRLVATVEHLVTNPGRWVTGSLYSDDDGQTWRHGNWIDLGGHGHHDGSLEPTVAELSDGRLMMLIRTNLDRFWQAFSDDDGRYWRVLQPTTIAASSSPGYLARLHSGRLALLYNGLHAEGATDVRRTPASVPHEVAASWFREELSLAFSEDDGQTWTKPLVIARQKGGQLSYPYIFERRAGELWLAAGFADKNPFKVHAAPLRLRADEQELLAAQPPINTPRPSGVRCSRPRSR